MKPKANNACNFTWLVADSLFNKLEFHGKNYNGVHAFDAVKLWELKDMVYIDKANQDLWKKNVKKTSTPVLEMC